MLRLSAEPKRRIRVTAPLRAPEATGIPARLSRKALNAGCAMAGALLIMLGLAAKRKREYKKFAGG